MELTGYNLFLVVGVLTTLVLSTDALTCFQCNVFIRGTPWPCESDRGMRKMDGCRACLKTYTRSYLHNTFHDVILTSYESRVCVKDRDYVKEEGCHAHEVASGYMKRCFCYTDECNMSAIVTSSRTFVVLGAFVSLAIRKFI